MEDKNIQNTYEEEQEETTEVTERTGLTKGQTFAAGAFVGLLAYAAGRKAKQMIANHKEKKAAKKAQKANPAPAEASDAPESEETDK